MVEKYTYYINFGSGFVKSNIHDNRLTHFYRRDQKDVARVHQLIEGSFAMKGNEFTLIDNLSQFGQTKDIPFKVYENGDESTGVLIFNGFFNKFNDFNYNEKKVFIKEFNTIDWYTDFLNNYDQEFFVNTKIYYEQLYPEWPIYCDLSYAGELITTKSYNLVDVINTMLIHAYGGGYWSSPISCDVNDFWYNPTNRCFDPLKYRIANLKDIAAFGEGGSSKKMSLKRLLEILQIMHKIFWYIDPSGKLKFKTPHDLDYTRADYSNECKFQQRRLYNFGANIKSQAFTMSDNNNATNDDHNYALRTNKIIYEGQANKVINDQITEVCTRYTKEAEEYNQDGFFFAYVNPITNKLIPRTGNCPFTNYDNCKLSPSNLIWENHRDYVYIDNERFTHTQFYQQDVRPYHLAPFIEVPPLELKLNSILNFIDSYIFEIKPDNQKIVLVYEMATELNSNKTILKGYEYANTKYSTVKEYKDDPPPPPPADILVLDPLYMDFNQNGGTVDLNITCNTDWTAFVSDPSVVIISSSSGNGNAIISVQCLAGNTNFTGYVAVSTDELNKSVSIARNVVNTPVDAISVNPAYINKNGLQQIYDVNVITAGSWSISCPSWMIFSQSTGNGNTTIQLTVQSTLVDRTGVATFTQGTASATIYIIQQASAILDLTIDPVSMNFAYNGETKQLTINPGASDAAWSISSSQTWCTPSVLSGIGTTIIDITTLPAPSLRSATLTITNGQKWVNCDILQNGEPPYLTHSPNSFAFDETGGSHQLTLNSNTNWLVESPVTWITFNKSTGSGNDIVLVQCEAYNATRSSYIVLSRAGVSITIPVTQTVAVVLPVITVSPAYVNVPLQGGTVQLTVATDRPWTITEDSSNIWNNSYFTPDTGNGNATIDIVVGFSAAQRTGVARFIINGAEFGLYINQY